VARRARRQRSHILVSGSIDGGRLSVQRNLVRTVRVSQYPAHARSGSFIELDGEGGESKMRASGLFSGVPETPFPPDLALSPNTQVLAS
jgi:hypothetical protein